MSKKGKRLREFEKNNRTFNISDAQKARKEKYNSQRIKSGDIVKAEQDTSTAKPIKKKKKISNIGRLVTGVIIILFIASVGMSAVKIVKLKNERDMLLEKNIELTETKEDLTQELEHVNSSEYIEQAVRKQLKMIKENEILFIVPEEEEITE